MTLRISYYRLETLAYVISTRVMAVGRQREIEGDSERQRETARDRGRQRETEGDSEKRKGNRSERRR